MMSKTFALLKGWKPGSEAPQPSFDDSEVAELASMLGRLLYAPAELRERLQQYGVSLVPANFYSEVPLLSEVRQSFAIGIPGGYDACFSRSKLTQVLEELSQYSEEFNPPQRAEPGVYSWTGGPFSYSDAMTYYCMLRRVKPATVVEIGSGWSTLVADLAIKANGRGEIICVEPFPNAFLEGIPSVSKLLKVKAQDLDVGFFNGVLRDGDVLFIDSTHTVKHQSDCLHIYLKILPFLSANLTIHAHDIYLPMTMPLHHFLVHNISWTEQYLLYAYLLNNYRTCTIYGSVWHVKHNRQQIDAFMQGKFAAGGASFWFEQAGAQVPDTHKE